MKQILLALILATATHTFAAEQQYPNDNCSDKASWLAAAAQLG